MTKNLKGFRRDSALGVYREPSILTTENYDIRTISELKDMNNYDGENARHYQGTLMLSADDWLAKIIPERSADLRIIKSETGLPCIINCPEVTMSNPYINDESLSKCLQQIKEALEERSDSRIKSVLAVIIGSGGGKTRLLEECRRRLNKEDVGNVVIAVTMNCNTMYSFSRERYFKGSNNLPLSMILSILSRVLMVTHDLSFEDSRDIIKSNLLCLDIQSSSNKLVFFFRSAIRRIIRSIETATGYPLKRLVLMVDEVMMIKEINIQYLQQNEKNDVAPMFEEFLESIRQALLNEPFKSIDGAIVQSTLVISSLSYTTADIALSFRPIHFLKIPALSVEDVVSKWLLYDVNSEINSQDKFHLQLIAQTLLGVPRLLELAKYFILGNCINKTDSVLILEPSSIKKLYEYIFESITSRYIVGLPSSEKLLALVYGENTSVDSEYLNLLAQSYFFNTTTGLKILYPSWMYRDACDIRSLSK